MERAKGIEPSSQAWESSHSTDELRPHDVHIVSYYNIYIQVEPFVYILYTHSG